MTEESRGEGSIAGHSIEAALDVVTGRGHVADRDAVRNTLAAVTEDGVVTRDGVEAALDRVSTARATSETRLERAIRAYDSVRAAAADEAGRAVVRTRLDGLDGRLADVESRIDALGEGLDRLVERADEEGDIYEVARGIRRLEAAATACGEAADGIAADLEAFERWLVEPDVRYRELDGDIDAVAEALDELTETADAVAGAEAEGEGSADEVALAWFDAALRHRAMALMLSDLRWELDELRRWVQRPAADEVRGRLRELAARRDALGRRLDELAGIEHVRRFSQALAAVDRDLEAAEPPVEWAAVEATLAAHRDGIADAG